MKDPGEDDLDIIKQVRVGSLTPACPPRSRECSSQSKKTCDVCAVKLSCPASYPSRRTACTACSNIARFG